MAANRAEAILNIEIIPRISAHGRNEALPTLGHSDLPEKKTNLKIYYNFYGIIENYGETWSFYYFYKLYEITRNQGCTINITLKTLMLQHGIL